MARFYNCLSAGALLFCLALFTHTPANAQTVDTWTDIAPGIQHLHRVTNTPRLLRIHVLIADTTYPNVRIGTIIKNENPGPDSGETTSSMATRHGALAAINADFFSSGTAESNIPQGLSIHDGYKIPASGHVPNRLSWVMDETSRESFMEVYATTTNYVPPSWMFNAASGGPRLVRDGQISIENTSGLPSAYVLNPRTALGISQDRRKIFLATVDGRQSTYSQGMTGVELGNMLIELGAWQVMNLDGGGSTTFFLNGAVRNRPSDGVERRVANAVAVWNTLDQGPDPKVQIGAGFEIPQYIAGDINGQQGWQRLGANANIQTAKRRFGNQALEIAASSAVRTFTPLTNKVQWIDFHARRDSVNGNSTIYFGASSTQIFGQVGFQSTGVISYYNGNTVGGGIWRPMLSYQLGQWYRISIRVDYNTNVYNVYVNGRQYIVGTPFKDPGSTSGLAYVRLEDASTGSTTIDNFYIGTTHYEYPRVEPEMASVPLGGYLPMAMQNAESVQSWSILDERNPDNSPAAPGSIAIVSSTGTVQALALGSFKVEATDQTGRKDQAGRFTVVNSSTVSQARSLGLGTNLVIGNAVVNGRFSNHFYVNQPDRSSGIRVNSASQLVPGANVTIYGSLAEVDSELSIANPLVIQGSPGQAPVPLNIGSSSIELPWKDTPQGALSADALLVTVSGIVTASEAGRFFVQDGSASGPGIPVVLGTAPMPQVGRFVRATGPLGRTLVNGSSIPAVKLRTPADLVIEN